jgi:hypothetical protein
MLSRYRIKTKVIAEQRPEGILLRPARDDRLSWEDTARAMAVEHARAGGEFADMERAAGDGLASLDR